MPERQKGDVVGQKARWRKRQRERRDRDPLFAEKWRERRRYEKACAYARKLGKPRPERPERPQHAFDANPNTCRTCGGAIANGALYCKTVVCNPHIRQKRRRFRRK